MHRLVGRRLLSVLATIGAPLCATFCSSEPAEDSAAPVSLDDLPRLLADAVCDNLGACCERADISYDAARCRALDLFTLLVRTPSEVGPKIVYDATRARRCVEEVRAIVKNCAHDRELQWVCNDVFAGTVPIGQACDKSDQCVPGALCYPGPPGVNSQCKSSAVTRAKVGGRCVTTCGPNYRCSDVAVGSDGTTPNGACYIEDGLYCTSANTCSQIPALGERCGNPTCLGEAHCGGMGICVERKTTGPCVIGDDCASTVYCDGSQCQPRTLPGQPCSVDVPCTVDHECYGATKVCWPNSIVKVFGCRGSQ